MNFWFCGTVSYMIKTLLKDNNITMMKDINNLLVILCKVLNKTFLYDNKKSLRSLEHPILNHLVSITSRRELKKVTSPEDNSDRSQSVSKTARPKEEVHPREWSRSTGNEYETRAAVFSRTFPCRKRETIDVFTPSEGAGTTWQTGSRFFPRLYF